jgi:hypothetical protein
VLRHHSFQKLAANQAASRRVSDPPANAKAANAAGTSAAGTMNGGEGQLVDKPLPKANGSSQLLSLQQLEFEFGPAANTSTLVLGTFLTTQQVCVC